MCEIIQNPSSSFSSSPPVAPVSNQTEADLKNKDWVFINYTYKRFEGLTARGAIPSYMKSGKRWASLGPENTTTVKPERVVQKKTPRCLRKLGSERRTLCLFPALPEWRGGSLSHGTNNKGAQFHPFAFSRNCCLHFCRSSLLSDAFEGTSLLSCAHMKTELGFKVIGILSTCFFFH